MKIREGFVSNSSSSSFIAAIPNECYEVEIVIKTKVKFIDHCDEDAIKTKEQLDKHIILEYGCKGDKIENILEDSEWLSEIYPKCIKEIENGKVIIFGSFSSDSHDSMVQYLCENGLNGNVKDKNVKIIHSKGGY